MRPGLTLTVLLQFILIKQVFHVAMTGLFSVLVRQWIRCRKDAFDRLGSLSCVPYRKASQIINSTATIDYGYCHQSIDYFHIDLFSVQILKYHDILYNAHPEPNVTKS